MSIPIASWPLIAPPPSRRRTRRPRSGCPPPPVVARRGGAVPVSRHRLAADVAQRVGHRRGEVGQPVEGLRPDRAHDPQQLAYRAEVADLAVLRRRVRRIRAHDRRSGTARRRPASVRRRSAPYAWRPRARARLVRAPDVPASSASSSRAVSSATDPTGPAGGRAPGLPSRQPCAASRIPSSSRRVPGRPPVPATARGRARTSPAASPSRTRAPRTTHRCSTAGRLSTRRWSPTDTSSSASRRLRSTSRAWTSGSGRLST